MRFNEKEVLNDVWSQTLILLLLMALSVDSLKCVLLFAPVGFCGCQGSHACFCVL